MIKPYDIKMELSVSDRDKILDLLRGNHERVAEYLYHYSDNEEDRDFLREIRFMQEEAIGSILDGEETDDGKVHISFSMDARKQLIADFHTLYSTDNSLLVDCDEPLSDDERNELRREREWALRFITGTLEYHVNALE